MDPLRFSTREAILILTLIGVGIGLVFGLVPLIYGRIKGKKRLGLIGFGLSILAGAIWSVLPLFVMLTFVFLILREPKPTNPDLDDAASTLPTVDEADDRSTDL